MTSGISFSGLYSNIDWNSMVEQLIQIEHRKVDLISNRQTEYDKKLSAWQDVESKLNSLKDKVNSLKNQNSFNIFSFSSNTSTTDPIISGSTSTSATPGSHTIKVTDLATERKLSSKNFEDNETALNFSGEIVINGEAFVIDTNDTLVDIRDNINLADVGVTADIITVNEEDYRLILTADDTGDEGFTIFDASTTDVLQDLGITDNTVSINRSISNGAESERYTSKTSIIKSLLNLTTGNNGTVQVNGTNVTIDLSSDTLEDIAANIDAVAGVTASVEEETIDNVTYYYLKIQGTTAFTDDNNILETIGILKGGVSEIAEVQDGSVSNTTDGVTKITSTTAWSNIFGANVQVNDTITFTGLDHSGNTVSGSLTIDDTSHTVQELLTEIETAFSSSVTASIADGKIRITDDTTGNTYLSLTITENNEGGGILDFGTISATTKGRQREIDSGQDSSFLLDGIPITKNSNTISDVLPGVTVNLLQADETTTINFNVTRNITSIKNNINSFVSVYNDIVNYINSQFKWDEDKKKGGVLMGDGTLFNVQSQLRENLFSQVTGLPSDYLTYLNEIGITADSDGVLSINDTTLTDALNNDFDNVKKLFIAFGDPSDNDIEFVSYGINTVSGNYDIDITTAAEKASITGSTAINGGGITGNENLTITDTVLGTVANVSLTSGDTLSTIISKINTELQSKVAEVRTGSVSNTTDGVTKITAATTWAQIFGANVAIGDTITLSGTNRYGAAISGSLTIDDTSHQVQELLDKIESIFSSQVTASINSDGKIVITDRTSGNSSISLSITENNEGGGSLDFGTIDLTTEGRNGIEIIASDSSGKLLLTHNSYGSNNSFSIVSDVADLADGNSTGIGNILLNDTGIDVAGTINGESATGQGQILTGDDDEPNVEGLAIRVTLTGDELLAQGSSQGTLNLTLGIASKLYSLLYKITDNLEGYVSLRQDSLENTIDTYQDQIDAMESRLERQRELLIVKFTEMEKALAMLKNQMSYLQGQISNLNS